ncbi:MAG: helix-hairpin-helix domain-containing protein [Geminicoccaceae bacterium]
MMTPSLPAAFDQMRTPWMTWVGLWQEQHMDMLHTGVELASCADPARFLEVQAAYANRSVNRWLTASSTSLTSKQPGKPTAPRAPAVEKRAAPKTPMLKPEVRIVEVVAEASESKPAQAKPAPVPSTPSPKVKSVAKAPAEKPRQPDDLTAIKGIGPKMAETLSSMGIKTFEALAKLTPNEVTEVEAKLGFAGRVERDGWIEQAKAKLG